MDRQCTARKVKITDPRPFLNYNGIHPADENDRLAIKISGLNSSILENIYQNLYHISTKKK